MMIEDDNGLDLGGEFKELLARIGKVYNSQASRRVELRHGIAVSDGVIVRLVSQNLPGRPGRTKTVGTVGVIPDVGDGRWGRQIVHLAEF